MSNPSLSDLYSALLESVENATLLANQIDQQFGTSLSALLPTLPADPPTVAAVPSGPVYGVNGATAPDADRMVVIKAVEDFRAQYRNSASAQVRNLATGLKARWFIQDTLDSIGNPDDAGFVQVQANTGTARTMLSLMSAAKRSCYPIAFKATRSDRGLFTEGDAIPDGGSFAGDLVIGGKVVWTGVRIADVPPILAALLKNAINNPTINNQ